MSQCSRLLSLYLRMIPVSLFVLAFSSCAKTAPSEQTTPGMVQTKIKEISIDLELALTRQQQAKGLMFRKSLPADQGMLFVFKNPKPQSFWMKNTLIPLDIAYIDSSGVIREIYPMYPNNQNSVASKSREIQFALEVNQGWFASKKIAPGDAIDLDPLKPVFDAQGIRLPEQNP